jgi:hypothetical protein
MKAVGHEIVERHLQPRPLVVVSSGEDLNDLAAGGGAGDRKDAGADNRADSESREALWPQRAAKLPFRLLGGCNQGIDALGPEEIHSRCGSGRKRLATNEHG